MTFADSRGPMIIASSKKVVATQLMEEKTRRGLVVDDDDLLRRIHGTILTRHGLAAEAAENGKVAVDLFRSGKVFDVVLMDLEMPVMNGIQATEHLRAMGVSSLIVGITACGMAAEKEAFLRAGLDACLEKPLTGRAVVSMLDQLGMKLP